MTYADSAGRDRALLAAVLDRIIPADDGFPGGGEIATEHVARMTEADGTTGPLLEEIQRVSARYGGAGFAALSEDDRDAVLQEVEASHSKPFAALVVQTYGGYYSDAAVLRLLGMDPRPPQPRGHKLAPLDPGLLDQVRSRGPIYRAT